LLAALVSPKINPNVNSSIAKSDSEVFLDVNNSHYYPAINKVMIWLTEFGREVFWPLVNHMLEFRQVIRI
jgi:hypothetical protein